MMCKFKNGDKVVYQKGSNFECYGTFKAYEFADICWVNFTSGPDNGRCKWTHEDNLQHRTDSDISIKLKVEIYNKNEWLGKCAQFIHLFDSMLLYFVHFRAQRQGKQ